MMQVNEEILKTNLLILRMKRHSNEKMSQTKLQKMLQKTQKRSLKVPLMTRPSCPLQPEEHRSQ
jgi:hypothetical protein